MDSSRDSEVLARQNEVLNRFEQVVRDFQRVEGLTTFETMNVLIASAAHNIGHGAPTNASFQDTLSAFVARVRQERAEHQRDCRGKPSH